MKGKCIRLYKYNSEQVKEIVEVLEALGDIVYTTTRRRITDKRKFPLSSNGTEFNILLFSGKYGWTGYGNYHSVVKVSEEIGYEEIIKYHPKFNSRIKIKNKVVNVQIV